MKGSINSGQAFPLVTEMEDEFSESLTPPVSPFAGESLYSSVHDQPPCFTCASTSDLSRDETKTLSSDGYVSRGALKRLLLKLDPAPGDFETDTVDIFGFSWVTETALVESTKLLFGLFRQKVLKLESLVQSSSHDFGQASGLHYEAEDLRQQCVLFLQYVKVFISRFLDAPRGLDEGPLHPYEELEAQLPSSLVEELFGITLLIGRLKDLPANVQSAFTIQHHGKLFPPSWHLLHLHLDVHWCVLETLHLLGQRTMGQVVYAHQFVNLPGDNLTNVSLFEEHLNGLLCDLIGLALNKYSKVRPTEVLSSHHYHCLCTKELWVLLIHLLEHRSKTTHTPSFWGYVTPLLQSLLKGAPAGEQRLPSACKDPLGFTWWLVTHLAQVGQHSRNGSLQTEKQFQLEHNWSFVCELLKSTCDPKGSVQEEQIRMHVHCCLSLTMLWEPNTSAVTTLWEYYSKNLNASFAVPWLGVSGLGSVGRGPLSLLELAQACCSPAPLGSAAHTQLYRACSSFAIFLRVLALHLAQENAGGAPWRQIKGRIYSKFHQRRMAELSELGLMNFLLLFLVLARSAELEDVSGRAFDLMALLPAGTMPPTHRALLWRGQLALLLLYVGRGLDAGAHADRLATSFAQVAREFYLKTTEPSRKLALWQPLGAYLDGVTEVLETSGHLCQAEERLLNEGFAMLLPACRQSELASALAFLQTALAQLRRVHQRCSQAPSGGGPSSSSSSSTGWTPPPALAKERHLAVAAALWKHFFPFLRSLRLSQTPPPQLADAAAGFTVLALDMPSSAPQDLQPHPVQSIMHCFGWDEMLHPLLVSRFLNHLLQNSEVVASVSSAQGVCVRAWLRCVLQQYLHKNTDGTESRTGRTLDEQLCELTRLVLRLPEVESVLQRAGLQTSAVKPEPKPALAVFIKAVGRVYSGLQLLSERSSMVARALDYVGDVLKYIKPYQLSRSQEGLQLSYWAVGCLVKHWSPLLATSKAQQLLFRIVDSLLLPHSLYQQDPPTQVLSALKESLPLYLQGLAVAVGVSQSQGAPLKQQLRNVISQYLGRFLPATPSVGAVANHPVLLAACEATPTPRGAGLRRNILQVISDSFLQFKGHAPPPRLAAVLSFLLELLRRSPDTDPALLSLPLPALLRCLMLVNEPQVRRLSTEAVQLVVGRCGSSSAQGPCDQTVSILRTFVEENEGVYDQQMYGVLEAVSLVDRSSVEVLIPVVSLSLRNLEQKRGLGKNTSLRNAYKRLLGQLGESGQAEKVCLDAE